MTFPPLQETQGEQPQEERYRRVGRFAYPETNRLVDAEIVDC